MKQRIIGLPAGSIDWGALVIMGKMMPPRDPDEEEDDADDEHEEEPPVVREPDED